MTEVNDNTYLTDWWIEGHSPVLNKRNRDRPIVEYLTDLAGRLGVTDADFKQAMRQFMPRQSKTDENLLAVYKDSQKYAADNATYGKPAKMLRYVLPTATEKDREAFAVWYKEVFLAAKNQLTLHIGRTRQDFKHGFTKIYRGSGSFDYHCSAKNKYGIAIKSQADSCMRYAFTNLPCHPAEVYASGDWEIVTVRDPRGKVYARTVCCIKDGGHKFLPIYTSGNKATEMILDYINSLPADANNPEPAYGIENARLLKVPYGSNYYVHPYVDNNRYTAYGKDFLYVTENGSRYSSPEGRITFNVFEIDKPYEPR